MSKKAVTLLERFLAFVQEYIQGSSRFLCGCELSEAPEVLIELARDAGFEISGVEFGYLYVEGKLANRSCPYILLSLYEEEMEGATLWVNAAVELVAQGTTLMGDFSRAQAFLHQGRSVGEIPLGEFGTLQAGPEEPYDHNKIPRVGQVGLHKDCGGAIRLSTQGPDKLVCTGCGREQVVPPAIYTFADLRRAGRDLP